MENKITEKIEGYLKLLESIKVRVGDDRIAMDILKEVQKDLRMEQIREERASNGNSHNNSHTGSNDRPATQPQINYLRKLGVSVPTGLTKKRASELIDEALAQEEPEEDSVPEPYAEANFALPWQAGDW